MRGEPSGISTCVARTNAVDGRIGLPWWRVERTTRQGCQYSRTPHFYMKPPYMRCKCSEYGARLIRGVPAPKAGTSIPADGLIVNMACNELHIAVTEPLRVEKYNRDSFHNDICKFAWKETYHSIQRFRATPVLVSCPLVTLHNQVCQGRHSNRIQTNPTPAARFLTCVNLLNKPEVVQFWQDTGAISRRSSSALTHSCLVLIVLASHRLHPIQDTPIFILPRAVIHILACPGYP